MRSIDKEECYKTLNLHFGASQAEIRQAFNLVFQKYRGSRKQFPLREGDQRCLDESLKAYLVLNKKKNDNVKFGFFGANRSTKYISESDKKLYLINGFNFKEKAQGMKPFFKEERQLEKIDDKIKVFLNPDSLISEQYRVIYTRFQQMYGAGKKKIITISSSVKGEGKTTTCLNLGMVIAKDFNKKVLIMEGDLKQPDLHTYLKNPIKKGLMDILLGKEQFVECIYNHLYENLFLLPMAMTEFNSSKFWSLPKMREILCQASREFDYIIIDSPPVLPLADMNIISELVDGILFVIRAGKTPRDLVKKAMDSLPTEKILAVILNGVGAGFGKSYGYPY